MSSITITKEMCEKWNKKRTIHPITGTKIIVGDSIYKSLYYQCINNGMKINFCGYKWMKIEDEDCDKYEKKSFVFCPTCRNRKYLFAVHEDGDYNCLFCDESVNLIYKCIYCKRTKKNIIISSDDEEIIS